MTEYFIRRALQAVVLTFIAVTVIFFALHLMPGDPVIALLGDGASPAAIEALRRELRLDLPLHIQYVEYVKSLLRFDLGHSIITGRPVVEDLAKRLPRSLELILGSTLLSLLIGVPLGVMAVHKRGAADYAISNAAVLFLSSPTFVVGTLAVLFFSVRLNVLPAGGYVAFSDDPLRHLQLVIMPCVTVAIPTMGTIIRMTRTSVFETIGKNYVRTAHAKGLKPTTVLFRHMLRNALIPIIALIGVQIVTGLGGTVVSETIFNWPGLSSLLVDASHRRDYPVVQGVILSIAVLVVVINLLVDLLLALVDPRIRYD